MFVLKPLLELGLSARRDLLKIARMPGNVSVAAPMIVPPKREL
jgi:hypothetical protein